MSAKLLVTLPELSMLKRMMTEAQVQFQLDLTLATLADILGLTGIELCVVPAEANKVWLVQEDDEDVQVLEVMEWPS